MNTLLLTGRETLWTLFANKSQNDAATVKLGNDLKSLTMFPTTTTILTITH